MIRISKYKIHFMKNLLLLVLFFCLINDLNAQTKVILKIENLQVDSIEYYMSNKSKILYPFWGWNNAKVDANGDVKLEFNSTELNFLLINVIKDTFWEKIRLFIKPNEEYYITVNPKSEEVLQIRGKQNEGQLIFSKMDRHSVCNGFDALYLFDTTAYRLSEILETQISNELYPFEKLLTNGIIDKEYYSIIKTDIECYNSYKLLTTMQSRYEYSCGTYIGCSLPKEVNDLNVQTHEFMTFIESIFNKYSFEKEEAWLISELDGYLGSYIWYKSVLDTSYNSIVDEYRRNLLIAKKYLQSEYYEYYYATKFNSLTDIDIMKEKFEIFKQEFPNSIYINGIARNIKMTQKLLNGVFKL